MFDLTGNVTVVTEANTGIAAVFLALRGSDYVQDHVLPVDGGWLGR